MSSSKFRCNVCFEKERLYYCKESHGSCKECINRGISICIAENKKYKCFECKKGYGGNIDLVINEEFKIAYDSVLLDLQFKKIGIIFHNCPFCPNRVSIDGLLVGGHSFNCSNCERESCIKCKKESHQGSCDHTVTENFIINCCGIPFIRGDACNKVSCPTCKIMYCWICKKRIIEKNYLQHFNGTSCPLYGETSIKPVSKRRRYRNLDDLGDLNIVNNLDNNLDNNVQDINDEVPIPIKTNCGAITKRGMPCKNRIFKTDIIQHCHKHVI